MIEIYSKEDCVYCHEAKELLKKENKEFTEHVIGKTISRDEVIANFPEQRNLPIVVIDGKFLGSYSQLLDWIFPPMKTEEFVPPTYPEMIEYLRNGIWSVDFKKADGSDRKMKCTLSRKYIQEKYLPKSGTSRTINEDVVKCFDMSISEWRSFRLDSVFSMELISEAEHAKYE